MPDSVVAPVPERLEELPELVLDSGSHDAFEKGHCAMELVSYLAGEPFSAAPKCASPILTSFLIRLNDSLPEDTRQKLKPVLPLIVGTRDGRDEERGWMIADWSIRVALPTWLEVAGVADSAKALRELTPITDRASRNDARSLVSSVRDAAWERRQGWRKKLREAVEVELKKRGIEKGAAAAAAADAVAAAAAVAAADAAAAAAAAADAVAAAVAAADAAAAAAADADAAAAAAADAVAAADAAAVAAADAVAAAAADPWGSTYNAVYAKVKPIYEKAIGDKYEPIQTELLASAIDLIERMCALGVEA